MIWVKPDSANVLFCEWMNEPDISVLPSDYYTIGRNIWSKWMCQCVIIRFLNNVFQFCSSDHLFFTCCFPGTFVPAWIRTGKHLSSLSVNLTSWLYNSVSVLSSWTFITVQKNFELKMKCFSPLLGAGYTDHCWEWITWTCARQSYQDSCKDPCVCGRVSPLHLK